MRVERKSPSAGKPGYHQGQRNSEAKGSIVRNVRLVVCLGYWAVLTALLLSPHPAELIGVRNVPMFPWGDLGIHFTAFLILTLMVHATRWPRPPRWLLVLLLLGYGTAAELLQALVPPRTVEFKDFAENVLGIAIATALYWLLQNVVQRRVALRPSEASSVI